MYIDIQLNIFFIEAVPSILISRNDLHIVQFPFLKNLRTTKKNLHHFKF